MIPAVAEGDGWVCITNWLAAAGPTTTFEERTEVTEGTAGTLKAMVIVLATMCERFVKLATPATAVAVSVPCKAPLPALRAAVTTEV